MRRQGVFCCAVSRVPAPVSLLQYRQCFAHTRVGVKFRVGLGVRIKQNSNRFLGTEFVSSPKELEVSGSILTVVYFFLVAAGTGETVTCHNILVIH